MSLQRVIAILLEDDLADFPEDDVSALLNKEPLWLSWAKMAGFNRVSGKAPYQTTYCGFSIDGMAHGIKFDYYCAIRWVSAPQTELPTHPAVQVCLYSPTTRPQVLEQFNLQEYTYETFVQLKALHKATAVYLKKLLSDPDGPAAIWYDDTSLGIKSLQRFVDTAIDTTYTAIKPK